MFASILTSISLITCRLQNLVISKYQIDMNLTKLNLDFFFNIRENMVRLLKNRVRSHHIRSQEKNMNQKCVKEIHAINSRLNINTPSKRKQTLFLTKLPILIISHCISSSSILIAYDINKKDSHVRAPKNYNREEKRPIVVLCKYTSNKISILNCQK